MQTLLFIFFHVHNIYRETKGKDLQYSQKRKSDMPLTDIIELWNSNKFNANMNLMQN